MNRIPQQPDDDIQRATAMVDEPDLQALFARHRPDADAFVRGVQQRLADRDRGQGQQAAPLTRAAGRLPLDLSWLGATKWTFLLAPAILLTLVGATFLGSLHWLRRTLAGDHKHPDAPHLHHGTRVELSVGVYLIGTVLLVVLGVFATSWLPDALLLLLTISMLLLVLAVRRHAAREGLDRSAVAGLGIGALEAFLILGLFWFLDDSSFAGPAQWQTATLLTLVAGTLVLLPLAPKASWSVLLIVAVVGWFGLRDFGVRRPDLDTLATFVTRAPVPEKPFTTVGHLASIVVALRENGRTVALPPAVDAALVAARDDQPAPAFVLTAEHHLGRIDAAEWQRLAGRRDHASTLDRLLGAVHPLQPQPFQEYEVAMLTAVRDLDDAARDHLAARLLARLDDATFPLQATAVAARWLDQIGRGELLDARRERIHALLVRHQHLGDHDAGGFTATLDNPHSNREATQDAIALMVRFGVPTALDLPTLHRHLRRASRLFASRSIEDSAYPLTAYVDQLWLERLVGVPKRSFLRTLQEERTFVAMAMLVVLCLYAAWAAPKQQALPPGAMP